MSMVIGSHSLCRTYGSASNVSFFFFSNCSLDIILQKSNQVKKVGKAQNAAHKESIHTITEDH